MGLPELYPSFVVDGRRPYGDNNTLIILDCYREKQKLYLEWKKLSFSIILNFFT